MRIKIEFWADTPIGRVTDKREFEKDEEQSEDCFADEIDEALGYWVTSGIMSDMIVEDNGWTRC